MITIYWGPVPFCKFSLHSNLNLGDYGGIEERFWCRLWIVTRNTDTWSRSPMNQDFSSIVRNSVRR
ncbi:hypothetical protein CsatB_001610 [Cannabis sativa]